MLITYFELDDPEFEDYDYKDTEYLMRGEYEDKPFSEMHK